MTNANIQQKFLDEYTDGLTTVAAFANEVRSQPDWCERMTRELAASFPETPPDQVARDVRAFAASVR